MRRARSEVGQAAVELALALPVVAFVLLAVLQVGLIVAQAVLVVHAAREGARAAAIHGGSAGDATAAAAGSGGLSPDRMRVSVAVSGGSVAVTILYEAPTDVPLVGALLPRIRLRSTATMRVEVPPGRARPNRPSASLS